MPVTRKSHRRSSRSQERMVPTFATPPGDTLREWLKCKKISQTLLAETMGRPIKTINEIIKAKARITEQTAIELEHATDVPAHFWLAMEANYRLAIARKSHRRNVQDETREPKTQP